eukprot:2511693-Rhodomonas_salina.9
MAARVLLHHETLSPYAVATQCAVLPWRHGTIYLAATCGHGTDTAKRGTFPDNNNRTPDMGIDISEVPTPSTLRDQSNTENSLSWYTLI